MRRRAFLGSIFALSCTRRADLPWPAARAVQAVDLWRELGGPNKPRVFHVGPLAVFRHGHVPGATFVGAAGSSAGLDALSKALDPLPKDADVVLYCGCCPYEHCPNIRPAYKKAKLGSYPLRSGLALIDMIPKNQSTFDRVVRVALGVTGVALVFVGLKTPFGWLGLYPLLTGLVGFCPLYALSRLATVEPPVSSRMGEAEAAEASKLIASGVGMTALASVEIAVGSVCPICVVAAPALITVGIYKRWRASKLLEASDVDHGPA